MEDNNIPKNVSDKIGRKLHNCKNHPIEIIKNKIYEYFDLIGGFEKFDDLDPFVDVEDNFDKLLIPKDHVSRSKSDTYYYNSDIVLRTHTSAHQNQLLMQGKARFLVTADVYRRDEIDRCHYPIFHQMEGVCLTDRNPVDELKEVLIGLVEVLFPSKKYKFDYELVQEGILDEKELAYFPFTNPSFELYIQMSDKWMEVLGCGVVHGDIMKNNNLENRTAWAFGLGLDRLAMCLFEIPDIRYFWSNDVRFLEQFQSGEIIQFKPYSNLDPITKDISFYIGRDDITTDEYGDWKWEKLNSFYEIIRSINDIIEEVILIDKYYGKEKYSLTFRIKFQPLSEINNHAEVTLIANECMEKIGQILVSNEQFNIIPRY